MWSLECCGWLLLEVEMYAFSFSLIWGSESNHGKPVFDSVVQFLVECQIRSKGVCKQQNNRKKECKLVTLHRALLASLFLT